MGIRFEIYPMVDVVFTLLLFFAVLTTSAAYNMGMKVQLPSAHSVSNEKKGVVLTIDRNQNLFLDRESISFRTLQAKVAQKMKASADTQVILNVEQSVPYTTVIQALDSVRLGGCFDVVLEADRKTAEAK